MLDSYSRYLLALHLSPSNDVDTLITAVGQAIAEAERLHGRLSKPPILVHDNGSNFLSRRFCGHVAGLLSTVRTRYRTPEQIGLLERFHRTLKAEEVYWHLYDSPADARDKLAAFRKRYNEVRPHWALIPLAGGDPVTPADVYEHRVEVQLPRWQAWARAAKARLEKMMQEDAERAEAA